MWKKILSIFVQQKKTQSPPAPNVVHQTAVEVYFSPGEACVSAIVSTLKNAKTKVDICVFTISDDRISREIIACHKRGVKVRILSDNEKALDLGSDISTFSKEGIPTKIDMTPAHMHHKFAIVDGAKLVNGSYNWTRNAATQNHENLTIMQDARMVRSFQQTFDKLWEELVLHKA